MSSQGRFSRRTIVWAAVLALAISAAAIPAGHRTAVPVTLLWWPRVSSAIRGRYSHLILRIVEKAHSAHLRVSLHVNNAADFHVAVAAGVDEIAHIPLVAVTPFSV